MRQKTRHPRGRRMGFAVAAGDMKYEALLSWAREHGIWELLMAIWLLFWKIQKGLRAIFVILEIENCSYQAFYKNNIWCTLYYLIEQANLLTKIDFPVNWTVSTWGRLWESLLLVWSQAIWELNCWSAFSLPWMFPVIRGIVFSALEVYERGCSPSIIKTHWKGSVFIAPHLFWRYAVRNL